MVIAKFLLSQSYLPRVFGMRYNKPANTMFSFIDRNGNIIHSVRNLDLRRKENTGLRRYNPPPRFISPDGVIHERIGFIDLRRKGNDFKRV